MHCKKNLLHLSYFFFKNFDKKIFYAIFNHQIITFLISVAKTYLK
jgi:hypothetical protein